MVSTAHILENQPLSVEIEFAGFHRLDGNIVGGLLDLFETNVPRSFGNDSHLDVIDSVRLRVAAPYGVALGPVAVTNAATILLGWRIDAPIARYSLHREMSQALNCVHPLKPEANALPGKRH